MKVNSLIYKKLFNKFKFYYKERIEMSLEKGSQFGMCFNMLKLKYAVYDESITSMGFLKPDDKINVFINLESAWIYLCSIRDLEKKIILNRNFKTEMVVDIVNIAGHYKEFFKNNGLETNVFLYTTDFNSEIEEFKESQFNPDFRAYYLNKYNGNPKYITTMEALKDEILPKVKMLCDFIPNVYYISGNNIDGSMIPYIIGQTMPDRQNFIVSRDPYETQYFFEDNFTHHLYIRGYSKSSLSWNMRGYLKDISTLESITDDEVKLFESNRSFYLLFLACAGEKYRSIDGLRGIGLRSIYKYIKDSIDCNRITQDTSSIELLSKIFNDTEMEERVTENFKCLDMRNSYKLLLQGEIKDITSQVVDRIDLNALKQLNQTTFKDNQLRLESLLC